ncbi:hypothetical protein GCM10027051_06180 [Niabella terrae]
MSIRVLLFGKLAELAVPELVMPQAVSLAALKDQLEQSYPGLRDQSYAVAVNERLVDGDRELELEPGCTVALMPPFSGG